MTLRVSLEVHPKRTFAWAAALRAARSGDAPQPKGWPPRYLARRIAWHALDHAWEIEDRADPTG